MTSYAEVKRKVIGALSVRECQVLAQVASKTHTTRALEVGHYLGLSTAVLLNALPKAVELVTIDHHRGDHWCSPTSIDDFTRNVEPYVGERSFTVVNDDMRAALPALEGTFGFVFYDADHTAEAVADFWALAVDLLEPECTLVFDDADWEDQSTLIGLAESAGFESIRREAFKRYEADKHDPQTYTLEIMRRAS